MKQVFNWTIGSFFRTIGRTIAFLVMGGLIYYILSSNGFEFGIRDLFFDKVNASEIVNGQEWHSLYTDSTLSTQLTYTSSYGIRTVTTNSNNITSVDYWFNNPITKESYRDYISFGIMLLGETYNNSVGSNDILVCDDWSNYNDSTGSGYFCKSFVDSNSVINTTTPISFKFNIWLRTSSGDSTQCTVTNGFVMCPLIKNYTYTYIRVDYNYSLGQSQVLRFGINRLFTRYINDTGQITNAIDQQTQQQQQNHEETQNYLEDSNTTEAEQEATSFFDDFDAPDIGGLSGIITAPLNTIRSLLNSTCTNLTLPLPFVNQNLTLPCMNTIYTQHFGAFFSIYQTIILALVAYRCIRSIFFDIHGFTNPNDDRIEVMDL